MAVYETFSKRMKRLEQAGREDVFQYDDLPRPFRVQAIMIMSATIGSPRYASIPSTSLDVWDEICRISRQEAGVFCLAVGDTPSYDYSSQDECFNYLLTSDTSSALDIIEIVFYFINTRVRKYTHNDFSNTYQRQKPDDAIAELNYRFKEHGIGYEFVGGELVRVDSQYLHAEAVKPAVALLHGAGFTGASEEFFKAHEYHRKGDNKAAIVEALKAFESTMKVICAKRNWTPPHNPTANQLIGTILTNGLISTDLQAHLTGLSSVLSAGLPTVRNKNAGHGQGETPIEVPDYMAAYALHMAASNIVFLVEAFKTTE